MSTATPGQRQRPKKRRLPTAAMTVAPYPLLAILVAVTLVIKHSAGGSLRIDLALCALAAAWILWMFTLHPAWRDDPRTMSVFFVGLLAVMAVLVVRDPWFGFFTPVGYVYAFSLLPWPRRTFGVAAVAVIAGTAQAAGVHKTDPLGLAAYGAVLAVNVLPMCAFAWADWNTDQHNEQREQALDAAREANRRLAATLAENEGLHAQLLAQAREAGVLDERQRMAREIHDTLAQGLTGIITQLQAAEQAAPDDQGGAWRRHFAAATGLARESLSEARRSVDALRPEPLEAARLGDAVAAVAERWSALHEIAVQVRTTGTARPMPPEAEVALLRTAQEALANAAKHAQATKVWVTLSYMERQVALDVRDDGRGFAAGWSVGADLEPGPGPAADPAWLTGGGFGLVAMRQRIENLAGTLQIESEPGLGTTVSACVPAAPPESEEPEEAQA